MRDLLTHHANARTRILIARCVEQRTLATHAADELLVADASHLRTSRGAGDLIDGRTYPPSFVSRVRPLLERLLLWVWTPSYRRLRQPARKYDFALRLSRSSFASMNANTYFRASMTEVYVVGH